MSDKQSSTKQELFVIFRQHSIDKPEIREAIDDNELIQEAKEFYKDFGLRTRIYKIGYKIFDTKYN